MGSTTNATQATKKIPHRVTLAPDVPQATSGTWMGSFHFYGPKIRGQVVRDMTNYQGAGGSIQDIQEFAYNGETFELLRDTHQGKRLDRYDNHSSQPDLDPRFWGWNLSQGKDLVTLVDTLTVQQIESVNWNGSELYHGIGTLYDKVSAELWINPEKSYRPERFMFSVSDGGSTYRVTKDFAFREAAPDLWFPEYGSEVTTVINPATVTETNVAGKTMRIDNVRLNERVPASFFSIEPPPGTVVHDTRNRETFKVE